MRRKIVWLGIGAFALAVGLPLGPPAKVEAHPNHPHCYELMDRGFMADQPWYALHHPCGHQGN